MSQSFSKDKTCLIKLNRKHYSFYSQVVIVSFQVILKVLPAPPAGWHKLLTFQVFNNIIYRQLSERMYFCHRGKYYG